MRETRRPARALTLPPLQPWARSRDAARQLLSGATVRMCLPVALVVGTLISVVNQADVVLAGALAAKVAANYAIPFLTSSMGALLAVRRPIPTGARPIASVGAEARTQPDHSDVTRG